MSTTYNFDDSTSDNDNLLSFYNYWCVHQILFSQKTAFPLIISVVSEIRKKLVNIFPITKINWVSIRYAARTAREDCK